MGGGGGGSGGSSSYRPNKNGYYGRIGQSNNSRVRNLPGGRKEAKNFFDNISQGYTKERELPGGKGIIREMSDGRTITYRPYSSSDNTAVIDIYGGTGKNQKIHFID